MSVRGMNFLSIVTAGILFSTMANAQAPIVEIPKDTIAKLHEKIQKTATNEVLITFKEGKSANSTFNRQLSRYLGRGKHHTENFSSIGAMHIKSDRDSTEELMSILQKPEFAQYIDKVTPNNIMTLSTTSDSLYSQLWAIENKGQSVNGVVGTDDADMDVAEAWNKTTGNKDVIVAVLDTGVDYTHSDLRDNMWSGAVNHGYDFAADETGANDDNPMPDLPYADNGHFHGTHVAGTIGSVANNALGVAGVAQNVSIMALKVFRPSGAAYSSDILEAFDYISQKLDEGNNIVAINASYGGSGGTQDDVINTAIKALGEKGVVFCAAAGNESSNNDAFPTFPASYDADNIITIAATDQNDALATFSNYGATTVDVAAPGVNILSTYPDNQYAYLAGTSMATPNVAGSIALLASLYPDSTVAERKAMILNAVDVKVGLNSKVLTNGRVNINQALGEPSLNTAPIAINDTINTTFETAISIDVLSNDSDIDNDTLTIDSFTTPTNGTLVADNSNLLYTPNDTFAGTDSFEYTITDGTDTATAVVTINVSAEDIVNTAPVAQNDTVQTAFETAVTIDVLANDNDEQNDILEVIAFTTPTNGVIAQSGNVLTYTPNIGFSGTDSFEYTVSDGTDTTTALVTVTVNEEEVASNNTAPVAKRDRVRTSTATPVTIDVLANDSDVDNDTLTIVTFTTPANGVVIQDGDSLVYTSNSNFKGRDSFEYTITDGEESVSATVKIIVRRKSRR